MFAALAKQACKPYPFRGTYVFEAEAGSDLLFAKPLEPPSSPSGNPTTPLLLRGLSRGLVEAIGICYWREEF
jgi:hypothetical protein